MHRGGTGWEAAAEFAAKIGVPLGPWQTVGRPHWRGGTLAEQEAAERAATAPVRERRSWAALDLLAPPGGA